MKVKINLSYLAVKILRFRWKLQLRRFSLAGFLQKMVAATGAGYVLFTVGHAEPYCPAPLKSWEKYHPGMTTRRDLIAELADA
jgi:hypothetical protein